MIFNPAPSPEAWQVAFTHTASLGESPFWHPHEQMLYWVDIPGKQVLRARVDQNTVEAWDMPSEPGCIAPAARGGLVIALRHGVFRAPAWGGPLQHLTTLDYDTTLHDKDLICIHHSTQAMGDHNRSTTYEGALESNLHKLFIF